MYGKTSIHFFQPKAWMNGVHYCTQVLKIFFLQMRKMCSNFILQKDGARCRESAYTLSYIRPRVPELVEP